MKAKMTKEHLLAYIDHMDEDQLTLLGNLIDFFHNETFGSNAEICEFCGIEGEIDTAKPQGWFDAVQDYGVDPKSYYWQYDEKNRIFGKPVNWALSLIRKCCKELKYK